MGGLSQNLYAIRELVKYNQIKVDCYYMEENIYLLVQL